ncbi:MAG: 2-dehydropantoate 2-reductase [Steroidobacteraceae bacterium]|jgi:2-dehydropantoate 2-reductase|nr:2-dehydropantoate 2-reductase [Steroidobacteraceae bacterium]
MDTPPGIAATTRVCVVGAGAIGGYLASRLVTVPGIALRVLARGAQLEAIRARGLRVLEDGKELRVPLACDDDPRRLGEQDVLVVALKAHALVEAAPTLAPLVGPRTTIVPAINGVPWWFLEGCGGALAGQRLASVDPRGEIARVLPSAQVLGCVLHMASAQGAPGVIHKGAGRLVVLGLPEGPGADARRIRAAEAIAGLFERAGLEVQRSARICDEVWLKLWGNMTLNPISALTRSTSDAILDDPLTARLMHEVMREAARIGEVLGIRLPITPEQRSAMTRKLGRFRSSMLQDLDAGRRLEVDALVGAPWEIAQLAGLETPWLGMVLGLARQLAANVASQDGVNA